MIKGSQFIANYVASAGFTHVFMLTGGGAMHLNDSLGKQPELTVVFNHHEQASSMAAESYARLTGRPAILNVTTGPGGINTINGVFGAWTDSVPMLVLSGQVRYDTTIAGVNLPHLRQMGDQECDIVRMVSGITKYAVMVTDPNDIQYHLQKAIYLATHGRPGPVWVDIPMNIQGAMIDPSALRVFYPEKETKVALVPELLFDDVSDVLDKLREAERPVVLVGAGVRASGAHDLFLQWLDRLAIPVVTAWNAHDALPNEHPCYAGRPGSIGERGGNFTVQNADLVLIIGSRLNIRQVSYNWQSFARAAFKIMLDIDAEELKKPSLSIDWPIHADAADFFKQAVLVLGDSRIEKQDWLAWCKARQVKFPVVLPEYWENKTSVNPYCFMQALSRQLSENQIVVTGDGTACVTAFQTIEIKQGMRLYTNSGSASMGYDIPAAIGACVASGGKKIICLAGDGSIMQNIQELAVIAFKQYPIKIFILNNQGYHSIRQTQQNFFGTPFIGVGEDSGLGFPQFEKVVMGFGLPYCRCSTHAELADAIANTIEGEGPSVCEVMLTLEQQFSPKLSSKRLADGRMVTRPLEDMAPFLSEHEMAENMLIPMVKE